MKRLVSVAGTVGLVCALLTTSAQAASATGARQGRIHGIVFAHGASPFRTKSTPLTYHGGAVMDTNTVYAIYWIPSGYSVDPSGAGYEGVIDNYFRNVAADNGKTTNVYFSDTQYTGPSNEFIKYQSSFGGSVNSSGIDPTGAAIDTDSYPASGCRDRYTSVCLTDSQLQTEISNLISARNLPTGHGVEYFLFTPQNVGSCFGSSCAYSYFC